ncbi:ABC transporter ATP-binding protein/permease [Labilibacter marinus]|uniref:ABC transporter ATP-binding protein/permease n=1 Tax=Labilibacter marinus TaxID=1477105 RepID=UPI00094F529F|nr:ABC transporter ATP-binding protein [Labilibacter marinus]
MQSNSQRLYKYVKKERKLISLGVLATLLMGLVELFTGSMLKFLIDLIDKFSGTFADGMIKNAKLPAKFSIKNPITNEKVKIFNDTLKGKDDILEGMLVLCLIFVGLYFLLSLFNYLRRVFMNAATQKILLNFKSDIYDKVVRLPYFFFHKNKTGDVVSRITYDVSTLNEIIDLLIEVARASIYLLIFIPVMFYMSWELSLFTILYFPLSLILIDRITKHIKKVSKKITDNVGDYTAFLEEKINRIKLVKSYKKEQEEVDTFNGLVEENYRHNLKLIKLKFALNPGSDFLGMIVLSVIYVFYSYKLAQGSGTLGDIVFFLYLVKTAYKPVKKVAQAWGQLHVALVSTKKIFNLLDEEEEQSTTTAEKNSLEHVESLQFKNVSFSYPDDQRSVIENINYQFYKGDIVGVKGKTGTGKTTLLNLIPEFYLPTQGHILFNEQNNISAAQKRKLCIYLGTDSLMINGSILQNIEYSGTSINPDFKEEFIQFIGLKETSHLDWVIGKDGVNLSDGQKQKVAFLRALICQPKVLILDEVFSSLDEEDVHYIIEKCKQQVDIAFIVSRKNKVLDFANKVIEL